MPILPVNEIEPFAPTLGIMMYPGLEEQSKAKAYAAQFLSAGPLKKANEVGYEISADILKKVALDAGEPLADIMKRCKAGQWIGELMAVWAILSFNHAKYASWSNVMKLAINRAGRRPGTETDFKRYRRTHGSVGHLWAAWMLRGQTLKGDPEIAYSSLRDFEKFMIEAELLRDWGQNWKHSAANSPHPLPQEVWQLPVDWSPKVLERPANRLGILRIPSFDEHELQGLAASG